MTANQVALWYLVASVFFILALKGLSSPTTSRRGNLFGMIGMAIAVLTTFAVVAKGHIELIILAILIGGSASIVGAILAAGAPAFDFGTGLGTVAVALAAVNVFGGFLVTQRMLEMFRKKERKPKSEG